MADEAEQRIMGQQQAAFRPAYVILGLLLAVSCSAQTGPIGPSGSGSVRRRAQAGPLPPLTAVSAAFNLSAFVNTAVRNISQTCDSSFQEIMLRLLYNTSGGDDWTNRTDWTNNVNCTATFENVDYPLPSHCCWWGVSCCVDKPCGENTTQSERPLCGCNNLGMVTRLQLPRNNLTGPLTDNLLAWLACELTYVDFSFNRLNGTINSSVSKLAKIRTLALGNNQFTGELPGQLRLLSSLQVLDVTNNNLTGSIPSNLCNHTNDSSLTDLLLANNAFTGQYLLPRCNNLVALDVTRNQLTGALPSFQGYDMLHIARMGRNFFNGTMPTTITEAPLLTDIDLSQNSLDGTIPENITTLRLLSYVRLNNNSLRGTIPAKFFTSLGSLMRITLADNLLTGTIPPADIGLGTLVAMDLSNNSLVGTIPESFKPFAEPGVIVNLNRNLLSCCGINPLSGPGLLMINYSAEAYEGVNWTLASNPSTLLPSFLRFSSYQVPVPRNKAGDVMYMRCPEVRSVTASEDKDSSLSWSIDPSYFLFYNCGCDGGYELINVTEPNKLPRFRCEPVTAPWYVKGPWILALIVVGATLVIVMFLFLICYRKGAKPAFMQQYFNMRKRLKGEPKDGVITVVTTDIEGYSDLMKREPELMGKGLRIHNYCIDKARWQFFGYTMEQEGDSFIVAFYDPFDAVAFCLQAQLLLQRVEWPEKLLNPEGGAERPRKGSMLTQALAGVGRILMPYKVDKNSVDGLGSFDKRSQDSSLLTDDAAVSGGSRNFKFGGSFRPIMKSPHGAIPEDQPVASAPQPQSVDPERQGTDPMSVQGACSSLSTQGPFSASQTPIGGSQAPTPSAGTEITGIRLNSSGPQRSGVRATVFNGLRVRMGIATGKLEKGTSLRSSSIMERSKVVSDAAAGGQVLMDQATFREVKERLVELGAVDHNGLAVSKMNLSKPTLLSYICGRGKRKQDEADIALVLDMGQYVHASATKGGGTLNHIFCNTQHLNTASQSSNSPRHSAGAKTMDQAAMAAVAAVDGPLAGNVDAQAQRLHIYQVVSPVLVERAHYFGSNLALKDEWICVDLPYFSAPGAAATALGLDASSSIPPITMVFAMVDGAKDWKPLHDKGRRCAVQRIMLDVLINTLMAVKGGYMCRLQEDEFKYMVAFPEPEDAARWCLIMQDALMWQDWPEWLLKQDKAKEEIDDKGTIVFRGPRLRMGMCHGCPRAIVPDHMGRADYHGASINSAARYMDAAAHGGQIVCEEETAMAIIAQWNGTNPVRGSRFLGPTPGRPTQPLHVSLTMEMSRSDEISAALPLATVPGLVDAGPGPSADGAWGMHLVPGNSIVAEAGSSAPPSTTQPSSNFHHTPSALTEASGSRLLLLDPLAEPPVMLAQAASAPPSSCAGSMGHCRTMTDDGSVTSLDLAAALRDTSGDEGAWRDDPIARRATSATHVGPDPSHVDSNYSEQVSLHASGVPEVEQAAGERKSIGSLPRAATSPGAFDGNGTDNSQLELPGPPAATPADGRPASPSRRSEGGHLRLRSKPNGRSLGGNRGATTRPSSNLSVTSTAWSPPPGSPTNRQYYANGSSLPADATGTHRAPSTGILKKAGDGQRQQKQNVRLQVPEGEEEGTDEEGICAPIVPVTAQPGRGLVSLPSQGSGMMTYRTSVSVHRLGGFMFKGSPDEVSMVTLLLENHAGRRFPPDPPKGKGGRTTRAFGMAGMSPIVELPNIARRYFWAWRSRHETPQVPSTPRGGNAIKGWAVNILMASRSQSHRRSEDISFADRPSDMRTSTLSSAPSNRATISDALSRSRNQLMGLVRLGSRLSPRGGVGFPDYVSDRAGPSGGGTPPGDVNELGIESSAASAPDQGNGSHRPPGSDTTSNAATATIHGAGARLTGTPSVLRSDSISSFIMAAEEGILQQQHQQQQRQQQQNNIIADRRRDGVEMV